MSRNPNISQKLDIAGSKADNKLSFYDIAYYFLIIVFTIVITLCLLNIYDSFDDVDYFKSSIDNVNYRIRSSYSDDEKREAADYLATIYTKVNTLVTYMKDNNLPNGEISDRLYHRWKKCKLRETSTSDKSVAFTVNKGTEIRLCIRTADGKFEDPNTAMFVILHELAHIASVSFGHNEEFRENFFIIAKLATKLDLYKPEDFEKEPKKYCNLAITTTPCSHNACSS
jgi:hypothetical protein